MPSIQNCCRLIAFACGLGVLGAVHAQTTAGAGTVLVIPLVAQTASYSTEVFVRNPNAGTMTIAVRFYEAKNSTTPGLRTCTDLSVAAGITASFKLNAQCTLTAASHFGMLLLEDLSDPKLNPFFAFSRAQTPGGNGFSVEAFPAGNFSGQQAGVLGLKRQAAAPIYQSNCFVGALGEAVDYSITLFDGASGAAIGTPIPGSLLPYESERSLDVFALAGAPAGDHFNVHAVVTNTGAGAPAFVALCTVQESTFFGADFRIAKSHDSKDRRQKRFVCYSQTTCGTAITGTGSAAITNVTSKNIHSMFVAPPDYISCQLVSARLSDLEMQVRGPGGDVFLSPIFPSGAGFDSGGSGKTSFYIFTGDRNAFSAVNGNDGQTSRVFIDVSFREGGTPTVPIEYGITCSSGNGVSVPYFRGTAADDF